ncbi:XdhC family protein [Enterococcus sp. HY326]|uniref:XdhC family protein n=1 Tax=Enterococcus sp. HY326 TaxID=2971265 RepID=UPI00223F43AB|nr:XdhC/CoxI family protein [Enterococcus sp. HY326]
MKEIFHKFWELLQDGQNVVLVTIIASGGSAPRKMGSRMLVTHEGIVTGTIGGGAVEYQSEKIAQACLKQHVTISKEFLLSPNQAADIGMICGGQVTVLCQFFTAENESAISIAAAVQQVLASDKSFYLLSSLKQGKLLLFLDGRWLGEELPLVDTKEIAAGGIIEIVEESYYSEFVQEAGRVFIFGGGHVAQALVPVLHYLDFSTVILDDRPDFLTQELFPLAEERILVDLANIKTQVKITAKDYAVVMTRGHLFDLELEEQLLQTKARYIGVMGSRHKVAAHIKQLREKKFLESSIERLTMPIGLAIGAQTPNELAISIAGQLIEIRSQT